MLDKLIKSYKVSKRRTGKMKKLFNAIREDWVDFILWLPLSIMLGILTFFKNR